MVHYAPDIQDGVSSNLKIPEGLGTCWIGAFNQDQIRAVLGIPAGAKVIEVMTLGYPADRPRPKSRKPMKELISYDQW
jgi:nitroreductase